ncbi:MAG: DUF1016 N-terminal domain-containing protein, partial [Sulfuritalea sp.]|nr:DUF1016 N-terminal domain-containing protein [Sulfuritalea sp.]
MTKKLGKAVADGSRLLGDVRSLIVEARGALATAVNAGLTLLYWNIGRRVQQEILKGERAAYGEQAIAGLAAQLGAEYGGGFGKRNLFNMLRIVEAFPDERIVHALRAQSPFQSRFESERSVLTLKSKFKKGWLLAGLWVCGEVAVRRAIHISTAP